MAIQIYTRNLIGVKMTDFLLKPHPTKEGYFVEDGLGEPISKRDHIFNFEFNKFQCSDSYSVNKQITFKTDDDGKRVMETSEPKEREYLDLRIDMVPEKSTRYSYIGTRKLIEKYTLIISDFDDYMCKHRFPHLEIFPHYDREDLDPINFSVFLYLDKSRVYEIRKRIINDEVNDGKLSFSTLYKGDIVFSSEFKYDRLSENYLRTHELDLMKYKYLGCSYPYKILPTNFFDYDRSLLSPYDNKPIKEFDLTFGKTIINEHIEKKTVDEPPVKQVIDKYLEEWMWRDPEEQTYD